MRPRKTSVRMPNDQSARLIYTRPHSSTTASAATVFRPMLPSSPKPYLTLNVLHSTLSVQTTVHKVTMPVRRVAQQPILAVPRTRQESILLQPPPPWQQLPRGLDLALRERRNSLTASEVLPRLPLQLVVWAMPQALLLLDSGSPMASVSSLPAFSLALHSSYDQQCLGSQSTSTPQHTYHGRSQTTTTLTIHTVKYIPTILSTGETVNIRRVVFTRWQTTAGGQRSRLMRG